MSVTWIVQNNVGSTSTTALELEIACMAEGYTYAPIQVIPFSNQLPDPMPDVEDKFVFYGRTSVILGAKSSPKWHKGIFFNPDTFTPEAYINNWGVHMLNADAQIITLSDVNILTYSLDDVIFIRPNDDLKMFTGGKMLFQQLIEIAENSTDNPSEPVNKNTKIVVASPKIINREWRLFIVDKKVVTGSQYIPNSTRTVPQEVIEFAELMCQQWTPEDIFVMDIAATDDELKIIECNCFNGSGYYASDLNKLVRTVSTFLECTWDD